MADLLASFPSEISYAVTSNVSVDDWMNFSMGQCNTQEGALEDVIPHISRNINRDIVWHCCIAIMYSGQLSGILYTLLYPRVLLVILTVTVSRPLYLSIQLRILTECFG